MDDKTLIALTALAQKLGTTAEYLWGVLLKQAPITGIVDLLVLLAWAVGCVLWLRFVRKMTTPPKASEEDRYPRAEWEIGAEFAWISVGVAFVLVALIGGATLSVTASALLNPEYWALQQILSAGK